MKIGWCTGIENADLIKDCGIDFLECAVVSLNPGVTEGLRERLTAYAGSPLPLTAWNILFPGHMKLVGPEADMQGIRDYISKVVETLVPLGAKRVVFGSGGPRRVPEGWGMDPARDQLLEVLGIMADGAEGTDLVFVLEPLNRKECNIVTSVNEAVDLVSKVDRPGVRALADFYHMDEEGEPLSVISENSPWLAHIHLADTGRKAPGTGSYPYDDFIGQLKNSGYSGTISVECRSDDLTVDAPMAITFLKNKLSGPSTI